MTGLGISPGEGNGNPPQYSCLENSMDRGAWWATVHGVIELDMTEQLSTHTHYIPRTYLFYNWKFVPFDGLHPIPPPPTSPLVPTTLISFSLSLFLKYI